MTGVSDGGEASRVAVAVNRVLTRGHPDVLPDEPRPWRVAFGRAYPGPGGVRRSYDEAGDALEVAARLGMPDPVVDASDLLIYQVILRDRTAIADLVGALLTPLTRARGGAGRCWPRCRSTTHPAAWRPRPPGGCTCPSVR